MGFLAILNVVSSFILFNLAIEFFILFDKRRGNGKEFPLSRVVTLSVWPCAEQWIGWVRSFSISFLSLIKMSGPFFDVKSRTLLTIKFFFLRTPMTWEGPNTNPNNNNKKKTFTGTARHFDRINQKWEIFF